jgi:hypothetical protein
MSTFNYTSLCPAFAILLLLNLIRLMSEALERGIPVVSGSLRFFVGTCDLSVGAGRLFCNTFGGLGTLKSVGRALCTIERRCSEFIN